MAWTAALRLMRSRYALAVLIVFLAAGVRVLFLGALGPRIPYVTFFAAVMLASLFGGFGPGLLATLMSALCAALIQMSGPPGILDHADWLGMAVFVSSGVLVCWVSRMLHRARVQAARAMALEEIGKEREDAIAALRQSRALLTSVIESLPFDFWAINTEGRYILLNTNAKGDWGDVTGKRPADLPVSEQTLAEWEENNRRALSGELVRREMAFERRGELRSFDAILGPIRDGGRILGALGVNVDITERKQMEETLRRSEADLAKAQLITHLGSWSWDVEKDTVRWSDETYRIFGVERESFPLSLEAIASLVHPDDLHLQQDWLAEAVSGAKPGPFECRLVRPGGEVRFVRIYGADVDRDPHSGSLRMFGAILDITDRKKSEDALRRSEAFLHEIGRFSKVGGWEHDLVTGEGRWTRELYHILECEDGPPPGPGEHLDYYQPEDRAVLQHALERAVAEGEPFSLELRGFTLKRRPIWVRVIGQAVHEGGKCVRLYGSLQDISDRKQTEEDLRVAHEAAQAANRAKSEFLANMSHEIRTPLSAILGLTELSQRVADPEKTSANLRMIAESARSLLGIVGDVLDLSRVEAGMLELENRPFDLRQVMREALTPYRVMYREKSLALEMELPDGVPVRLMGDPLRLGQVLGNLVGNAAKFTEHGGITLGVEVAGRPDQDTVDLHFRVTDTGIGIAPELREVIFDSFRQADSTFSKAYQGVGLGLAICRELTALMGGRVWVVSSPGHGSTFHFTARFEPAGGSLAADDASAARECDAYRQMSVLVAEDNPVNRHVFESFLTSLGHRARVAADGQEALELLHKFSFDLVLMDVQMPKLDGVEVVARMRSGACGPAAARLPVIALTAYAMAGDRERFLKAGMNGYLSKPVSLDALQAAVARYSCVEAGTHGESGARPASSAAIGPVNPNLRPLLRDALVFFRERLSQAQAHIGQGDMAEAAKAAHDIKGTFMAMGLEALQSPAAGFEDACRATNRDAAARLAGVLRAQVAELETALETAHESASGNPARPL